MPCCCTIVYTRRVAGEPPASHRGIGKSAMASLAFCYLASFAEQIAGAPLRSSLCCVHSHGVQVHTRCGPADTSTSNDFICSGPPPSDVALAKRTIAHHPQQPAWRPTGSSDLLSVVLPYLRLPFPGANGACLRTVCFKLGFVTFSPSQPLNRRNRLQQRIRPCCFKPGPSISIFSIKRASMVKVLTMNLQIRRDCGMSAFSLTHSTPTHQLNRRTPTTANILQLSTWPCPRSDMQTETVHLDIS